MKISENIYNKIISRFNNIFKLDNISTYLDNFLEKVEINVYKKEVDSINNIYKNNCLKIYVAIMSLQDYPISDDELTVFVEESLASLLLMEYFDELFSNYNKLFPGENDLPLSLNKEINDILNNPVTVCEVTYFMKPQFTLSCILTETDQIVKKTCDICNDFKCIYKVKTVDFNCGGNGKCGKCKVLTNNLSEITYEDRLLLKEDELEKGYRLMCKIVKNDFLIIYHKNVDYKIESSYKNTYNIDHIKEKGFGVCIDLGSTTIVMQLVNLETFEIIKTVKTINTTKMYGADILNRGLYYIKNQEEVRTHLLNLIKNTIKDSFEYKIKKVTITSNTILSHILLGKDLKKLLYENINQIETDLYLDNLIEDCLVIVPRCFSLYIGSDVTLGLATLDDLDDFLYVDLGTNGEVVYKKNSKYLMTSTACGPCFEGGNITFGTGAVDGAICSFNKDGFETINNQKPIGICGSGLIDIVSLNLNTTINFQGLIEKKIYVTSDIYINQSDIREFQLAKSAIYSSIVSLTNNTLAKYLYIAGGFGNSLNLDNCFKIGLFPKISNYELVGNLSLKGALLLLRNEFILKRHQEIIEKSTYLDQGLNKTYNDIFIENLNFK